MPVADRLPPLYEDLTRSIRVRHLQTPLQDALCLTTGHPQDDAVRLLANHNLDHAPVMDATGEKVLGFVGRRDLDPARLAPVDEHLRSPEAPRLISADASLDSLLRSLGDSEFLLVLDGNWISGLVTTADLDKQAARAFFYVLLVSVEVACAELVRDNYGQQEDALAKISNERGQRVLGRYSEALEHNTEADLVAYMELADLLTIIRKTHSALVPLGVSGTKWEDITGFLPNFRHNVVHPVRSLTAAGGLRTLVDQKARLEDLVHLLIGLRSSGQRPSAGAGDLDA